MRNRTKINFSSPPTVRSTSLLSRNVYFKTNKLFLYRYHTSPKPRIDLKKFDFASKSVKLEYFTRKAQRTPHSGFKNLVKFKTMIKLQMHSFHRIFEWVCVNAHSPSHPCCSRIVVHKFIFVDMQHKCSCSSCSCSLS